MRAYSCVVSALCAGGPLTDERRAALQQLGSLLGVGQDRHQAEVRRAASDELLSTVSLRLAGPDSSSSWLREGRRAVALLPRATPLTSHSSLAARASAELQLANSSLPPPRDTASIRPPPPASPEPPQPEPEFVVPEPVARHNGVAKKEEDGENGFVVLPSGMAVRLRDSSPPPGKRGKRKRSASSKSIEVFPDGLPLPRAASVLGAGHGYARPAPLPEAGPAPSPSKRGRPPALPGPFPPSLPPMAAPSLFQARGRPRLLSPGPRPRAPRPRPGVRPDLLLSLQPSSTPPLLMSQSSAVQVTIPPPRLTLRPAPPRPTTIQLKHETSGIQGLKVISHSTTKVMPKSVVSAVYMLPSAPRMTPAPHRLLAMSSPRPPAPLALPSLGFPTGVIRTVRARQPSGVGQGSGKPSVIVVQKSALQGGLRGRGPATVSLYRPAPRFPGTQQGGPRLPGPAGPNSNSNVILLDLAQEPSSHALSTLLSSGVLPDPQTSESTGGRKIFLQRPPGTSTPTSLWMEAPRELAREAAEDLSIPRTSPPTSLAPSTSGRMVTLPPRPLLSPAPAPSPPGLEVRPGRETNGDTQL